MKVAIDISPTKTEHSVRGIGTYTQNLVNEFNKGKWQDIQFEFFASPSSPPPVDIIHYPYFDFFFHSLPILKKSSRVVVTTHDVIPLIFPDHFPRGIKGNLNFFLQKLALNRVDAVICDSQTSKQDISDKLSAPKEKIHVVYLAPSDKFHPISDHSVLSVVVKKHKLPKKFVLYVGDINWSKNIPNLLRAISKLNIKLVMVGKALVDESLIEVREINKLVDKLNIKNKIIKTGFVETEELVAIYNLSSVTVLPSYYEGFGLPVLESMACGTPVVCSNVASLSEIGQNAAIFCNPESINDISTKIAKALNFTKSQREKLSKTLIKHASRFSWQKVAQKTIQVYDSLL